jgi:translocation protein SEC72
MRDQGNTALRRSTTPASSQEAIKLYTYALEMALGRPGWEPASLVRDEASGLYANRAQAHMHAGMWAEGAADAKCSVELKRGPGNGKAWWRRGKCLVEMGRWEEAREWVKEGLDGEGNEAELGALGREIDRYFAEGK